MTARTELVINSTRLWIDLDPDQWTQNQIHGYLTHGVFYEADTVRQFQQILRPGDTFIDVGAHVGYFSLIASALVGKSGKVIAFEPEPRNRGGLWHNLIQNDVTAKVSADALGNEDRTAVMFVNLDNDGGNALWDVGTHPFNAKSKETPQPIEVQMRRLDGLVKEPVRLLKIDTEGCETAVLQGARETLRRNPEMTVICEINRYALEQMGSSEIELRTFMQKELGYECWLIEQYPVNGKIVHTEPRQMPFGMTLDSLNVFNVMFKK